MGFVDERDLIDARAELYGMEVANLRQATPEVDALKLIPDSMAREHFVIPVKLDELGLHVAMADQPSPELLTLLGQASGSFDPTDAGASLRDPSCHRQQLPGHRWPRSPGPGIRGSRDDPEADARHDDSGGRGRSGRRRTGCPGGRPHSHPGHARPGIRRPHRADRGRPPRSLPDRRRRSSRS